MKLQTANLGFGTESASTVWINVDKRGASLTSLERDQIVFSVEDLELLLLLTKAARSKEGL